MTTRMQPPAIGGPPSYNHVDPDRDGSANSRPPSTTAKRPASAHHERRFLSTSGLAVLSARHPWRVLGIWLVIILLALVAASGLSDSLSTTSEFTGQPESAVGEQLLTDRLPAGNPISETIVIRSETIAVSDPAFKTVVDRVSANLAGLGDLVVSAPTYYQLQASSSPSADQLISADRHTTIIPVTFKGTYDEVNKHTDAYLNAVKSADGSDVRVLTVGSISANKEFNDIASHDLSSAEKISLPITVVILVIVFGALVAAGVPLVLSGFTKVLSDRDVREGFGGEGRANRITEGLCRRRKASTIVPIAMTRQLLLMKRQTRSIRLSCGLYVGNQSTLMRARCAANQARSRAVLW